MSYTKTTLETYKKERERNMSEIQEVEIVQDTLPVNTTPSDLLKIAVSQDLGTEKLEKLMELQERWDKNEARKAFLVAKAAFKLEVPTVIRDKKNKQYTSMYASEDALMNTINPILSKHGLETYFSFPEHPDKISVTCILSHAKGHSESVTLSGPLDTSGAKNALQGIKSTVTYLRKATYEAITGIATSDKATDDDGNGLSKINDTQFQTINKLIKERDVDIKLFLTYMEAESLEEIPAKDYGKAVAGLKAKKAK